MTAIPNDTPLAEAGEDASPLGRGTKIAYGFGSTAIGVINYGLSSLVLIFYNQVLGLPAATVGFAIMIALIIDAFWDPLVGHFSDRLRASWGRRHPLMYISALPIAVSFFLLWSPPQGLEGVSALAYLSAALIGTRMMVSFYEIPSASLAPEFAPGYHERTALLGYRFFFAIAGTVIMGVLAFNVFLTPNEKYDNGMLNREGYSLYGLVAGAIILVAILASALGTHHRIPTLHKPPRRPMTFKEVAREVGATLWNRSLIALTVAGMFAAIAKGLNDGLGVYFGVYFWQLQSREISFLAICMAISTVIAVIVAPIVSRAIGKKPGVIACFFMALLINTSAPVLRLLDLAPPNGSIELLAMLISVWICGGAFGAVSLILLSSMVADIVEDSQVKTGRRSEGLLFSADNILQKCVTGFGVFGSGMMLAAVNFPPNASPQTLDYDIVRNLQLLYLPIATVLNIAAAGCILFYNIDHARHEANLARIAEAAVSEA